MLEGSLLVSTVMAMVKNIAMLMVEPTLANVCLIPLPAALGIRELTGKVNEAREYLKAASGNYPDVPPNPKLCVNCILTPVCPPYRNLSNRLLGLGGG